MITRYEITATRGTETYLVAYTPRVSRHGVLAALRARADAIISRLAITDHDEMTWTTKPRPAALLSSGWRIGFTGRTERDARSEGEHPYIAST